MCVSGSIASPYASTPGGSSIISTGTVDETLYGALLSILKVALDKAAEVHGPQRTAALGEQGTPCQGCVKVV